MALPALTPEQQAEALQKATAARRAQAEVKGRLKSGDLPLTEALADREGPAGAIRVSALLRSLPGVGTARAAAVLERTGIDGGKRVRALGSAQRAALEAEFAPAGA